ncbi:MAG: hypothetical protein A2020_06255 [Lentisphaerae bacterium GWF2_45_14]|nr:MAG: hypothetical protein A2020_06255 [Lentisphaerae bacterium GWF2_45_14]
MNILKYFGFYYRRLGKQFFLFMFMAFAATSLQGLGVAAFVAVMSFGQENAEKSNLVTTYAFKLLNFCGITGMENMLLALLISCSLIFFLSTIILIGVIWYSAHLESSLTIKLQEEIMRKLFRARYEYFLTHSIGFLNNVAIHEMGKVSSSFRFLSNVLINFLLEISFLAVSVLTSLKVTILVGTLGVPLLFLFKYINKRIKHYALRNSIEVCSLYSIIHQILVNFKYLKAANVHPAATRKMKSQGEVYASVIRQQALWCSVSVEGLKPFAITMLAVIVYVQVVFLKGTPADSIVLMGILYLCYQKSVVIMGAYQKFLNSSGGIVIYEQIHKELDKFKEREDVFQGQVPDFSKGIEFKDVYFKYMQGDYVLNGMSFNIKPNSTVAFVGGSGAGKSTIVNLVSGLLDPQKGEILISGVAYKDVNLDKLRSGIGYVTQEPVVFNDTVLNNITLWEPSLKDNAEEAARKAYAHKFISEMEKGFDSMLGDDGMNISGGQRQRITIARELMRDTPLLILDEATSSLDSETEKFIQKSIDDAHGKRTMIIIAHRLSTVRKADKIYVLEKGRIIEEGTYDELYAKGGKFREMVELQGLAGRNMEG